MPIAAGDVSVAVNGDIRWTGGATPNYTVIELHRFLGDLADQQQASGDDLVDITSDTPSVRSTDNIITLNGTYNIDDDMAEHLYAGSITQAGGDTVYSGLQVLGAVNTAATQLMVIQDGDLYQFTTTDTAPFWGTQASPYNGSTVTGILMRILIKTRENGADFDNKRVRVQARHYVTTVADTFDFFNVQLGTGESVAAIGTTPDSQNDTAQATVTVYADVLNSGGTANAPTGGFQTIDLGDGSGAQPYYSQWTFGAQGDGLKALWEYTKDLSRTGSTKTIDTVVGEFFLGITHEWGYDGQTVNHSERDEICWGTQITYDTLVSGPFTPGAVVTIGAAGASGRVLFDDGTDLLIVALDDVSATITDQDVITEFPGVDQVATSTTAVVEEAVTVVQDGTGTAGHTLQGGSGILLADNDGGATGTMWIQLQSGVAPVDDMVIYNVDTPTADGAVNGSVTARTVPKIYTGSYTGSYIGAFGIGIDKDDLTETDTIEDLDGDTNTPPNNVTFDVTGLVIGEDYVLVGPRVGSALDKDQFTQSLLVTDNSSTTVTTTGGTLPTDTPASGTIRLQDNNGVYTRQAYDSYVSGTGVVTLTAAYQGSDDANSDGTGTPKEMFISYIDKLATGTEEAFTTIFLSNRNLFVRVRDGGASPIVTFEGTASVLSSTGGTIAAIRNSDA
jgi:hypothetical protein